jgi:uracil-DNA glycosylase family 4
MNADLCARYLEAMGVRVWRLRAEQAAPAADLPHELIAEGAPPPEELADGAVADPARSTAVATSAAEPRSPSARDTIEGMDWETLQQAIAGCRACVLCDTRTQTVFGVGDRQADLMIIGEAPGADEDRQGEPFVGKAGQLLNLMLAAIGLRREQVYIANILKCRPPGNRDPLPEEVLRCHPYLMRQIALIRPRVLLAVGRISAQNLLRTDTPIGRLRGRWRDFGPDKIPLMVTYHPAYLLRSPEQKARAWEDLVAVARRLREAAQP